MSSRRAVGEDNILAMLERDSARRSGTRVSSLRLAWYGAAAAFAGILAGGVAWLAYDNHKTSAPLPAGYEATVAAVPPMLSGAGAPAQPDISMLPVPAAELPRAALIVDESPPPPRASGITVPPLVMLPPGQAATRRAAAQPAPRAPKQAASAAPAKARPARATGKKADKAQRPAARAATVAAQRGATKTAADAPRKARPAATAPQVDSDVALISAIIAQSERHRGARAATAPCSGPKCPPQP